MREFLHLFSVSLNYLRVLFPKSFCESKGYSLGPGLSQAGVTEARVLSRTPRRKQCALMRLCAQPSVRETVFGFCMIIIIIIIIKDGNYKVLYYH